jgi:hypothetical protein
VLRNYGYCLFITSCSPIRLTVRRQPHHCTSHYLSYKSSLQTVSSHLPRHSSLLHSNHLDNTCQGLIIPLAASLIQSGAVGALARKWESTLRLHPPPNVSPVSQSAYSLASRLAPLLACEHCKCQASDNYPSYHSRHLPYTRILPYGSQILPSNPTT